MSPRQAAPSRASRAPLSQRRVTVARRVRSGAAPVRASACRAINARPAGARSRGPTFAQQSGAKSTLSRPRDRASARRRAPPADHRAAANGGAASHGENLQGPRQAKAGPTRVGGRTRRPRLRSARWSGAATAIRQLDAAQSRTWPSARHARPQARALAQATFGGRYADRFRDGDRRRWRHRHHRHIHVIGWIGPLFWPYAYDDFVDYTFWPYAYDAFWPYAYDDVYEGFFGPYCRRRRRLMPTLPSGSAPYAVGARTGARHRAPAAGQRRAISAGAMAQICTGETTRSDRLAGRAHRRGRQSRRDAARRAQRAARRGRTRRQGDAFGLPGRLAEHARRPHGGDASAARSDARRGADRPPRARRVLRLVE